MTQEQSEDRLMDNFFQKLPKVELHAHLNGSLSEQTIQHLCHLKDAPHLFDNWQVAINHGQNRTLSECFDMFNAVHAITTNPTAVKIATARVIEDFEADGVMYLELRSTPREVPGHMTKEEYVEAIQQAILRQGPKEAEHVLQIALKENQQKPALIAGLDLSGDPTAGVFDIFLPTLQKARRAGLGIVVHCGEVPNEEEVMSILDFAPDRLGHATCIHPALGGSQKQWESLLNSKIPVEICLTSNVCCKTVTCYGDHQFKYLYAAAHPVTISTDDKGVFCSSLSNEFKLIAQTFSLDQKEIIALSASSVDFCLTTREEKDKLQAKFTEFITT